VKQAAKLTARALVHTIQPAIHAGLTIGALVAFDLTAISWLWPLSLTVYPILAIAAIVALGIYAAPDAPATEPGGSPGTENNP
jgi:hypothetical protein